MRKPPSSVSVYPKKVCARLARFIANWRESVFRTELMTGWINSGANPMSRVTIASLRDLGYAVSLAAADAYVLPSPSAVSPRLAGVPGVELVDELIRPTYTVDPAGRVERIRPF